MRIIEKRQKREKNDSSPTLFRKENRIKKERERMCFLSERISYGFSVSDLSKLKQNGAREMSVSTK